MEERELYRDLSRMIRGELSSAEVKRLAQREGFRSFSELCETRLPEELGRVRLGTKDLLARIDKWRRRSTDLYELWFWADELYNISFNHRIAYEPRSEDLIMAALSAISVIANERLFPNHQKTARALEYIRACLLRRRKFRLRNVFLRIFEDLSVANLANKNAEEAGEDGEKPRWADVVLLDRPWRPGTDVYADYNWMIAFTVTTRELFEEERAADAEADRTIARVEGVAGEAREPDEADAAGAREDADAGRALAGAEPGEESAFRFSIPGWREGDEDEEHDDDGGAHGRGGGRPPSLRPTPRDDGEEVDRIPALRRLVPNFDFARLKPVYLHDGDGIAEIVLDAPAIGRAEVEYAAKLFCLANRVRECRLDGRPLKTLIVKPGAGKRFERP